MKDWLRLLRISNLPTVWSSVLVAGGVVLIDLPELWHLGIPLVSASCLYLAGMVLNDVFDHRIDAIERPDRPIPSGRIGRRTAAIVGVALLAVGTTLPFTVSPLAGLVALALAAIIVAYDALHARTAWSTVLMGLCRGGVYLLSLACLIGIEKMIWWGSYLGPLALYLIAGSVAIHVFAFSMIARREVPEAPPATCPACGYAVATSTEHCSECGASCDEDARRAMQLSRIDAFHQRWGTPTLALLIPFITWIWYFLQHISNIQREQLAYIRWLEWMGVPAEFAKDPTWDQTLPAVFTAIAVSVLVVALVRATRDLHRHPEAIGRFVLRSIRNISLYDACLLVVMLGINSKFPIANGILIALALGCYFATMAAHRRIPGT